MVFSMWELLLDILWAFACWTILGFLFWGFGELCSRIFE